MSQQNSITKYREKIQAKRPRREKFDAYWAKRPEKNNAVKKDASYWFHRGRLAEMKDLQRIWEYNKIDSCGGL